MAGLSNFLEKQYADRVWGRSSTWSIPNTLYIELFTALPDEDGENGIAVSTSGGTSYARKGITNSSTSFDPTPTSTSAPAQRGVKANKQQIAFALATAPWGLVVGWGIYDAATGGNLLVYGEFQTPKDVGTNDVMKIDAFEMKMCFHVIGGSTTCALPFFLQRTYLDWVFGQNSTYVVPSSLYAAMMTTMPDDDDASGVELTTTGNGYARAEIANNSTTFPGFADGLSKNAVQIAWSAATADWEDVAGVVIFDAASGGNRISKIPFSGLRTFSEGQAPRIAPDNLSLYLD